MGCYLLRKQLCFPTRCSGTAMICSCCEMMIICYSQPTRGVVTGFCWAVPTAQADTEPEKQAGKFVLLLIHLISLSSLLWPLLTLNHPEEALGSWSQPLDHSHTSTAPRLWWSSASHWKPQVEELTQFSIVSFSVFVSVTDSTNSLHS